MWRINEEIWNKKYSLESLQSLTRDHFYSIIYVVTILESACGQKTYFLKVDDTDIFLFKFCFNPSRWFLRKGFQTLPSFNQSKALTAILDDYKITFLKKYKM
jgi:hypothetical protein